MLPLSLGGLRYITPGIAWAVHVTAACLGMPLEAPTRKGQALSRLLGLDHRLVRLCVTRSRARPQTMLE